MSLPGLYTTKSELKRLESLRCVRYRNRTLKHNAKLIKYKGAIYRFENSKVVCGDQIFIQDPQNCIFATQDLRELKILGVGEIVGTSGSFLIFKRGPQYHVFSNGIVVSMHFYLESDKLLYRPASRSHEGADVVQRSLTYKGFFVVQSERNVLFINLSDNTDVQFRFPGPVFKVKRIVAGKVEYVFVRYAVGTKGIEYDALFYYDQIVSQALRITRQHGQYVIDSVQGLCREGISQYSKRNVLNDCASGLQIHAETIQARRMEDYELCGCKKDISANFSDQGCQTPKTDLSAQDLFLSKLVASHHTDATYEPDNQSNVMEERQGYGQNVRDSAAGGARVLWDFSPLEEQLFEHLSLDRQVLFLRSRAEGRNSDIVMGMLSTIIHRFESIESLCTKANMERHGRVLSALRIHDPKVFFHQAPDLDAVLKSKRFLFRQPFTKEEVDFLGRRYSRIFRFDPTVDKSENLAYTVIHCENARGEGNSQAHVFSRMLGTKRRFNRLFKSYLGDIRIQDVVQFMLENSIAIQPDVNDVAGSRQNTFLLRSHSNVGSFIMNLGSAYCDGYLRDAPKINNSRADDKVSQDIMFLNGACLSTFYKKSSMGAHYDLGTAFGNGLIKGLSDEDTQKYLKMVEDADEKTMRHLLLIISTRSIKDSAKRSTSINSIFKSQAESQDMGLRRAALCALAIYNYSTNDSRILEILTNECRRFGPSNPEKNGCFYDRDYRILSALCCGLVATKPMSVALDDSFCELLINGLSSVGSGCSREVFYRTDNCRPQEAFYSQLFELVCDFSTPVDLVIRGISLEGALQAVEIFRMSAKIFYVALKSLRDQDVGCVDNWLFDLAERAEEALGKDPRLMVVFTMVLAALSIVKSGTCDLKLLRILRRQILKTKDLRHMDEYEFFDYAAKDRVRLKGCGYESMQMYKTCVGIVCSNFGMSKARADIKQIIVTFFVQNSLPFRFSYVDILRMLAIKSFEPNQEALEALRRHAAEIDLRCRRKRLCKLFKSRFSELNALDKKVVVDILSDYYENYHHAKKGRTIFDLRMLAKLVAICK